MSDARHKLIEEVIEKEIDPCIQGYGRGDSLNCDRVVRALYALCAQVEREAKCRSCRNSIPIDKDGKHYERLRIGGLWNFDQIIRWQCPNKAQADTER